MPEKKEPPKAEVPEWVLTFGDLMSLLLCFFILLAAFSEIKKPREYQDVVESVNEALGASGGLGLAHIMERVDNSMVTYKDEKARRDDSNKSTDENVNPNVPGKETQVNIVQEGARHAIGASIIFDPGSFELSKRDQDLIRTQIAPKIRGLKYICPIVGHAWGVEEKKSGLGFDELAYKRAQAVKDFLVREGGVDPTILRVESAGNTEPVELGSSSGQGGDSNRRVQIYQTGRTVDQVHPDPNFTGADG
ncbi:MAG: flagellar motor protein MotB [Phycisphaerales bacterium]|nr:flagellar motor protein MotB [Phycisphaerales bacterium]